MNSYSEQVITYQTASTLIEAAIIHAESNEWTVAVVVLDPDGHVVASARMNGVSPSILDFAADKGYTAALGKSSYAMYERMHSTSVLELGLVNRPRLCVWEGGLPIYEAQPDDGKTVLIGAIGVSGAEGPDDVSCAEHALQTAGLKYV